MKTFRTGFFVLLAVTISLGGFACFGGGSASPDAQPQPTENKEVPSDITGTTEEKLYAIAETVTEESEGILVVSYAEAPVHRTREGNIHYGAHYNVFVVKRADLFTAAEDARVRALVGRIFQLTTEHIIALDPLFSHMGVQVFDADVWFHGGHERGSVIIYIANRENLLERGSDDTPWQWFNTATEYPEVIIEQAVLQGLIQRLRSLEENK